MNRSLKTYSLRNFKINSFHLYSFLLLKEMQVGRKNVKNCLIKTLIFKRIFNILNIYKEKCLIAYWKIPKLKILENSKNFMCNLKNLHRINKIKNLLRIRKFRAQIKRLGRDQHYNFLIITVRLIFN